MPELSVVIPTYNERANVAPLAAALAKALDGIDYEIIFVDDDSPDSTAALARELAQHSPRVRTLLRVGRRGLAGAVVEGFLASSAPYLAAMDADLQHDESILPDMFRRLRDERLDLVIATRNAQGGSMGEFAGTRIQLSQWGRRLSRLVTHVEISDPMSGYFALTRSFLDEVVRGLSNIGFKVLLDLLATARRPVRIGEVGYTFRARQRGVSKMGTLVGLEYLELLLDKWLGRWIPVGYLVFGMVGTFGVLVNLALTSVLLRLGRPFQEAQLAATSVVIALNFFLNNALTFRAWRLHGWRMLPGLLRFYICCGVGVMMDLFIADSLGRAGMHRALASSIAIFFSSVWNYGVSSLFVWRTNQQPS